MAYRILKKNKEAGLNSLYTFITESIDGVNYYKEFNTAAEVDAYVEEQLNLGVPKTYLEVVAPMSYTVSASIDEEPCGCGVPSTNPKPTTAPYKIIANPVGGIVEKGTKITFIIDADRTKFQKLVIDGTEIKNEYYTVTSGSTIISLVGIYADTLSLGEHTIEFIFKDGKAEDKFEIVEKKDDTEPTTPPVSSDEIENNEETSNVPDNNESTSDDSVTNPTEPSTSETENSNTNS